MEMRYQLRHSPEWDDRCATSRFVELRGFEPLTLSMPWRCATSCAIAPFDLLNRT